MSKKGDAEIIRRIGPLLGPFVFLSLISLPKG